MNPRTPLLYGLPKVHKTGHPIRPVVSFIDSPCHKLSSWLNVILRKVTEFQNIYSIKNSLQFANYLKNIDIPQGAILISLDVKNLFPSIPPSECITLIETLLNNTTLPKLVVQNLVSLLSIILHKTFFKFNNKFFTQCSGLAMGSNLSPFLSEVFMNSLEKQMMTSRFGGFLTAYKRYVDDICIVWNGSEQDLTEFLDYVNSLHNRISFTIEKEQDGKLPFLDLLLTRKNNKVEFEVYRKPSSTDNIIQFTSNTPHSHKFASFNSLFYRLFKLPLTVEGFNKELNIIKGIARNNGFPMNSVNKIFYKFFNKYRLSYNIIHAKSEKLRNFRCITFFGNISMQLAKFFKYLDISIAFKTVNSVKRHLVKIKDRTDELSKSGVYSLSCGSCPAVYVGQSGRKVSTRVQEHLSLVNKYKNTEVTETKSAFANHLLTTSHDFINPDNVTLLHNCQKSLKLDLLEKMEISRAKKSPILTCVNDVFNFEPTLVFNNLE